MLNDTLEVRNATMTDIVDFTSLQLTFAYLFSLNIIDMQNLQVICKMTAVMIFSKWFKLVAYPVASKMTNLFFSYHGIDKQNIILIALQMFIVSKYRNIFIFANLTHSLVKVNVCIASSCGTEMFESK